MRSFLLLSALFLGICAHGALGLGVQGTLGTAVSVAGNSETTITYLSAGGAQLVIELDSAADVTLSAVATLSAAVPGGYSSLALSASASGGLQLAVSGSASIVSARLTTPPLTAAAAGGLTGTVQAACLRWDADAQAYTSVAVDSVSATKAIVIDLPVAGVYAFASVDAAANVPLPTLYLEARATTAGSTTRLSFPGGLEVQVKTTTNNELTVGRNSTSTHAVAASDVNIGGFLSLSLRTEEAIEATITVPYDGAAVTAAKASLHTLALKFWSTASASWVMPDQSASLDASASVLVQQTTHFSDWAVFAEADSEGDGDDDIGDFGGDLGPASPSACHRVLNYDHIAGVLAFTVTKSGSSGGNIKMHVKAGHECPTASNADFSTEALTNDQDSESVCYTSSTTPAVADGDYAVTIVAEGLSGTTESTSYELEVANKLACPTNDASSQSVLKPLVQLVAGLCVAVAAATML